ncbi:MAG: glycosyltransferase family 4 protein [Pseudomonadota bacterium]
MHIAFFTSLVMDGHPTTGYEIANQAIIDGLRGLGHRVSVIGFRLPRQAVPDDPDTHVLDVLDLENASAGTATKLKFLLRAFRTGLPISASKLTVFPEHRVQATLAKLAPIDVTVFNSYQMAAAFPNLFDQDSLFLAHNVEHLSACQNAASAAGFLQRRLHGRDARLLAKIERHLCKTARWVWTLSDEDGKTLGIEQGRGGTLSLSLPDNVHQTAPHQAPSPQSSFDLATLQPEPDHLLLTDIGLIGTWTWEPNRVGLEWFLKRVAPLLPGDLTIKVAGAVPDGMPKSERVEFLGRVPSASAFLDTVRVVPLVSQGGTGVQLKTIEAFQSGLACVASASSLRGIAHLPRNCRRANDPVTFAAALTDLVIQSRSGTNVRIDGAEFLRGQRIAFEQGLKDGLSTVSDSARSAQRLERAAAFGERIDR